MANKQNALVNAVTKTQNEITTNQNAANKYFAQANSLGLAQGYVNKIKNGTLNIESITDDNLKDKISKYKDYYEKGLSAQDKVLDLQDKLNELYQKRLEIIEKEYDTIVEINDSLKDKLDAKISYNSAYGVANDNKDNINSINKSIGNAKQKISDLTTGLQKVKKLYDNGVISLKEYNEKSAEYRKELQSSTSDVKSYQKSLIDLYQNALKTEVDALQKVISKRKEATQAKEEYYSYDKKIREQTNDVNALKSQVAALEGVNDTATLAKKKKLEQQLKDAQETLDDTKRDHRNDLISKGYDKISDDLNQMLEDTEYEISHNADKQNEIIQSNTGFITSRY